MNSYTFVEYKYKEEGSPYNGCFDKFNNGLFKIIQN